MFEDLHDHYVDFEFDMGKNIIVQNNDIESFKTFPLLTNESISILLRIIETHKDKIQSNKRTANYIRGLGYHSSFIRDLCYHQEMLLYLQKITGLDLVPHYLFSNIGHINIGLPNEKDVDDWHYDSVPYVLIILISEPENFTGGRLEYELDGHIQQVYFPIAGSAFFMKGSSIKHHVTRVCSGKRISLINSYIDKKNPHDETILKTFEHEPCFSKEIKYRDKWFSFTNQTA